jgi:hypothetical protein
MAYEFEMDKVALEEVKSLTFFLGTGKIFVVHCKLFRELC